MFAEKVCIYNSGFCAAVEKIERANSAKIFSGTARGAKR